MSRTFEFFNAIDDFKEVVPGVESSTRFSEMQASFERAKQIILGIIGQTIWDSLKADFASTSDGDKKTAWEFLQGALGNRTYFQYLIFKLMGKRKEEVDYRKYEIQAMQEVYIDNYWLYMDKLLPFLDTNPSEKFAAWLQTDMYKTRDSLFMKTAAEFSKYCNLDYSEYFFFRTLNLHVEVMDVDISSRKITTTTFANNAKLERNIKRAIAYRTMSNAIMQLDYTDLPRSLRNDIYNELSKRTGHREEYVKSAIAKRFAQKSDDYFSLVDIELQKPDQDAGESTYVYIPPEDVNDEDNQHYLMV